MNRVTYPLKPGSDGPAVTDLQAALTALLERGAILPDGPDDRRALTRAIAREAGRYGDGTAKAVSVAQDEAGLQATGAVDEKTAARLNALLDQLGLPGPASSGPRIIAGQVLGDPLPRGLTVLAFLETDAGPLRLGTDQVDATGGYAISYSPPPTTGTALLLVVVAPTGERQLEVGHRPRGTGVERVDLTLPPALPPEPGRGVVTGQLGNPGRPAPGGILLRLFDVNPGNDLVELAQGTTGPDGRYQIDYALAGLTGRGKNLPDLMLCAYDGAQRIAESPILFDAGRAAVIDLTLPETAPAGGAEFTLLEAALKRQRVGRLRDMGTSDPARELAYLAGKTGWDARAVAMAALSDRFAADLTEDGQGLNPDLYYALFRAGLPADPATLYATAPATVDALWRAAEMAGVIAPAEPAQRKRNLAVFRAIAAPRALDLRAAEGASSLREIIARTLEKPAEQQAFARLRESHRNDAAGFWPAVEAEFGPDRAAALRLDGQLTGFALRDAELVGRIHDAGKAAGTAITDPSDLARQGYYAPEAWHGLLDRIPPEIEGETEATRRDRAAQLLAALVRLAYPTLSLAHQVETGALPVEAAPAVGRFLSQHHAQFVLGSQPVAQFAQRAGIALDPMTGAQIERIQRVHQITRDDAAMGRMLARGFDSAAQVARLTATEFATQMADELGGEDAALATHAKASQIHATVLSLAATWIGASQAPAIGGGQVFLSAGAAAGGPAGDVVAMPVLERLLGAMDYCGCEHCRSALSPAAYLVDLLDFLDTPAQGGTPNPLTVLLQRRPDLAELALTCENTNTVLPHIDLVNEILGHYLGHDLSMAGFSGHDVQPGDRTEDLLAAPRHPDAEARRRLAQAIYPPPLPWSAPLAALRAHFHAFDTELWHVIEALRPDETSAGWREILHERAGFSPAEIALLTDGEIPLADLAGLEGATEDAARDQLSHARSFARRAGISYAELADLLGTRFVNPETGLMPRLARQCLAFATLNAVKAGSISAAELRDLLPSGLDPAAYGGDIHAWIRDDGIQARIRSLIVLTDEGDGSDPCSFDDVHLRRTDPDPTANRLRSLDYRRMLHFLRLWRRLGWSMAQLDAAISALMPAVARNDADPAAEGAALDAAMAVLLDRLGGLLMVMDRLNIRPGPDLDMALTCWADLGVAGPAAPYARLFLNPAVLALTPAFADDGYGALPGQPATPLLDAAEALRAAFGLTGDEFALLAAHLGFDAATPLTLANISGLARHIWLSRRLKISLREFLELRRMTGIDPFAPPGPLVAPAAGALAAPACVQFIDLIQRARAAGLKPADLLRLFAGLDLSGRADPSDEALATLAHDLRAAMAAADAAIPAAGADPGPEALRTSMALAYGAEASGPFLGLIEGTATVTTTYDHDGPELAAAIVAAGGGRLSYDDLEKTLSYGGLLTPARAAALKTVPGTPTAFAPAIDTLAASGAAMAAPLFAAYPELAGLHADFDASTAPEAQRYRVLLDAMLGSLIAGMRARVAVDALAAALPLPLDLAQAVLRSADVLHAQNAPGIAALSDLTGIAGGGLQMALHMAGDLAAAPDLVVPRTGMGGGALPMPMPQPLPGTGIAAVWSGWIDAPESGAYALSVQADAGSTVTLRIDGVTVPMAPEGDRLVNTAPMRLSATRPLRIELKATGLSRRAVLRWSARGLGWQVVPERHLYPQAAMAALAATCRRMAGLGALAAGLKLTTEEMIWLARLPELRIAGEGWFNALPDAPRAHAAAEPGLTRCLNTLTGYAALRKAISPDDAALCRLLAAPEARLPGGMPALEALTGWSTPSVAAALSRLGLSRADLARPDDFARLARVMAPIAALRIPADALFAAATTSPGAPQVAALQSALRARHSAAEWRELLKPVNDRLRRQERDALVARILHLFQADPATRHIDTPERLFEFFLIDVAMQPCFETSRIRAALSSVQLFVDRALMNLEPRVPPPAIRPDRWEWMRRYRIWEANRKVFLWPENWLEPELRDDQSPAFREVIGSLLQSDITEDAAAQALGSYLIQLDEVARLEPCGMFIDERAPGLADDVVHVVARSHGAGRRYFHRSRQGGTWAPWQPVKLDIEDAPVIPCVWRDRLFLFWLTIRVDPLIDPAAMDTGPDGTGKIAETDMASLRGDMKNFAGKATQVRVSAILNWSEKRGDEWLAPRASDPARPAVLGTFAASGASAFDRANLQLSPNPGAEYLNIGISGAGTGGFTLYSTHGAPVRREDMAFMEAVNVYVITATRSLNISHNTLTATYNSPFTNNIETRRIVATQPRTRLFEAVNHLSDPWRAPFILGDSRHLFYVRTEARPVTIAETVWVEATPDKHFVAIRDFDIAHEYRTLPKTAPPDPIGPITKASRYEIARFVGADTRIQTALTDDRVVNFDGVAIGLEGPVANLTAGNRQR